MSKQFSDWILGVGPASAKIFICGEFPGKYEEATNIPITGPGGELLGELLETAGSSRSQCYITNVVKIRPPQDDLELLNTVQNLETFDPYSVEDFLPLLNSEIEAVQPNVIIALGSLALKVLTGHDKPNDIKNYRGSILRCLNAPIKVIPTIHPSALFGFARYKKGKSSGQGMFTWKQKSHIQFDFIKAVRESFDPDFNLPQRNLRVIRQSYHLQQFFDSYISLGYDTVYVDTEVFKATLVCIGFAFTPDEGVSIPLTDLQTNENHDGIPLHELVELWDLVDEVLSNPKIKIVGQNFKADQLYWLEVAGFTVNNFYSDGMFMIHTLSPELPKSLAFQQSIFTNEPYHKSEGKEYNPFKDKIDNLLLYNAKDCVVNCECVLEMSKDIEELGLSDFYYNFVMALSPIYQKIEKKGILIDKEKQKELSEHYRSLLIKESEKRLELLRQFGIEKDINFNSPKQVGSLIFGTLRCPEREDTRNDTLTALMNTKGMKDQRKKDIINSILDSRSLHKIKETYVEAQIDTDGRMRTSYNQVGTETGRTSTSTIDKPLRNGTWGIPFQTIPRPDEFGGRIREMYIPDPGKTFAECDQSQAEARIVALLAEDYEFLELFDILDVHKLTASFCYGLTSYSGQSLIKAALNQHKCVQADNYLSDDIPFIDFSFLNDVIDEQRQIGKNTRHGANYDLGEEGLAIKQRISLYRAKTTMEKIHEMSPKIRGVFHESIQNALGESRVFWTPFGRRREFFEKWGKSLFREAYAHIPQSVIGDNTKRLMLGIKDVDWIELVQEGHDSILAQIPIGKEKDFYDVVKPVFEQEIDFSKGTIQRQPIVIPCEFKFGPSWGNMVKYKSNQFVETKRWSKDGKI